MSAESTPTYEPDAAASQQSSEPTPFSRQVSDSSGSFELVLSGLILGAGGWFIDRWLGTTPIFLIVCTILGLVGSALSIYYRYRHQIEKLQQEAAQLRAQAGQA